MLQERSGWPKSGPGQKSPSTWVPKGNPLGRETAPLSVAERHPRSRRTLAGICRRGRWHLQLRTKESRFKANGKWASLLIAKFVSAYLTPGQRMHAAGVPASLGARGGMRMKLRIFTCIALAALASLLLHPGTA